MDKLIRSISQHPHICAACRKPISRGEETWWLRDPPNPGRLRSFHLKCKPIVRDGIIVFKRNSRKKDRESQIRKELRERGVCYRNCCQVKISTDKGYEVSPWFCGGSDYSYHTNRLKHVITTLLEFEDLVLNGKLAPSTVGTAPSCKICTLRGWCSLGDDFVCERFAKVKGLTPSNCVPEEFVTKVKEALESNRKLYDKLMAMVEEVQSSCVLYEQLLEEIGS